VSIIYDALKKVEKSGSSVLKETAKPVPASKKVKKYLFYVLFLAIGLFSANIGLSYLGRSTVKPGQAGKGKIATAAIAARQTPAQQAPLPQTPAVVPAPEQTAKKQDIAPVFSLNGIFYSGDESYALINNQIVKHDDKISGAVVKEISANKVMLDFNGSAISLTTGG